MKTGCVVLVWPTESFIDPEVVGPFPDRDWAQKYVDRVLRVYYKVMFKPMLSPILLDPRRDDESLVVFDPEKGIDR